MKNQILLKNMKEKKLGYGEDSKPILLTFDNSIVLGVFDGVGGSGGATCKSSYSENGEDKTKAYIGSRIVRDAIETALLQSPTLIQEENFNEILKDIINKRYVLEKKEYPPQSKGILRSTLIKEYPTTLAITTVYIKNNQYVIDSYWAGDSRNYLWNEKGLFQISLDDLKGNLDPLQNLYEDAQMTNCVQADSSFKIRHKRIFLPIQDKFVLLAATDGCFGYYPSPMDFYKALITSLQSSDNPREWEEKLTILFEYVTADDLSFALAAVGFRSFKALKKDIKEKSRNIKQYFYLRSEFERLVRKRNEIDLDLKDLNENLNIEIQNLWPEFKVPYLKYMQENEEG